MRVRSCGVPLVVLAMTTSLADAAEPLISFLPAEGLERFVVAEFDIRTISSSINPRRQTQQAHFSDTGILIAEVSAGRVVLAGSDDTFTIQMMRRGDSNNDGIEDVVICLSEKAKVGTLISSTPLLLQKYSNATPLIALAYNLYDKSCEPASPRKP